MQAFPASISTAIPTAPLVPSELASPSSFPFSSSSPSHPASQSAQASAHEPTKTTHTHLLQRKGVHTLGQPQSHNPHLRSSAQLATLGTRRSYFPLRARLVLPLLLILLGIISLQALRASTLKFAVESNGESDIAAIVSLCEQEAHSGGTKSFFPRIDAMAIAGAVTEARSEAAARIAAEEDLDAHRRAHRELLIALSEYQSTGKLDANSDEPKFETPAATMNELDTDDDVGKWRAEAGSVAREDQFSSSLPPSSRRRSLKELEATLMRVRKVLQALRPWSADNTAQANVLTPTSPSTTPSASLSLGPSMGIPDATLKTIFTSGGKYMRD